MRDQLYRRGDLRGACHGRGSDPDAPENLADLFVQEAATGEPHPALAGQVLQSYGVCPVQGVLGRKDHGIRLLAQFVDVVAALGCEVVVQHQIDRTQVVEVFHLHRRGFFHESHMKARMDAPQLSQGGGKLVGRQAG